MTLVSAVLLCAAAVLAGPAQLELRVFLKTRTGSPSSPSLVAVENVLTETPRWSRSFPRSSRLCRRTALNMRFCLHQKPPPSRCAGRVGKTLPSPAWDCYPDYSPVRRPHAAPRRRVPPHLPSRGPRSDNEHQHTPPLSRPPDHRRTEVERAIPEILLTSTMHGDETTGFVLLLRLAWVLLESYGVDPEVTELVRGSRNLDQSPRQSRRNLLRRRSHGHPVRSGFSRPRTAGRPLSTPTATTRTPRTGHTRTEIPGGARPKR